MKTSSLSVMVVYLLCAGVVSAQEVGVRLIGKASIAGDLLDRSGLENVIGDKVPHNRLGSFGSGIDWTGKDDVYLACNDRGPGDGASAFRPRVQRLTITIDEAAGTDGEVVKVELLGTTLLSDERGEAVWGYTGGYDTSDQVAGVRVDPEGVRVDGAGGAFWISEEYGPWIERYGADGKRTQRVVPPSKFMVEAPDGDAISELARNTKGRQANRGFEGLARSADGSKLWAILQSPLIQDGASNEKGKRTGVNVRVLEVDVKTSGTRELVYVLEDASHGVSEILGAEDGRLLVLERDGKPGAKARARAVYVCDITEATDVSEIDRLPAHGLPVGAKAMSKKLLIDLMNPAYGLTGEKMPEKVEGLCWGPKLKDGKRALIVTSDNDLKAEQPTWVWVFGIAAAEAQQPAK